MVSQVQLYRSYLRVRYLPRVRRHAVFISLVLSLVALMLALWSTQYLDSTINPDVPTCAALWEFGPYNLTPGCGGQTLNSADGASLP